ncbi:MULTISPECIES: type II secretion system F family protein [Colwellia]|uniref:Pilus assembly protein TadB n=1 Tax=Colwellia marinimaniae TaxID=1513592 RepID=A0ABQ0MR77_9GAMM|nr:MULTISPECIES: type II secretion system F family protein [Colwellia]GAW94876.1 pilus assembly protein TadB [Colwellia marinimaniae]
MSPQLIFLLLVFAAVVLLAQSLFVSVYSPQRADTKQLKKHLLSLALTDKNIERNILLNSRVAHLPPFTRWLETLPLIENLTYKMEISGSKLLGHQYLAIALATSSLAFITVSFFSKDWLFSLIIALLTLLAFHLKLNRDTTLRMEKIEEQFPEAMDVLKRGLQAGYAFSDAIKLVFEEMDGYLADEFKIMFNRINFGNDTKTALLYFVKRVPSTSAMAFSSAVAIQKSTGGNLAENIDKLSKVIRQRFTFKRKIKTLSAEGRLSGWVLVLMPFVLFAVLYISSPNYVAELTSTPAGINLLKWGGAGMLLGIFWIKKLIQIEV